MRLKPGMPLFEIFLRTGLCASRDAEHKFNPWHDPESGRFTFANGGRYFPPRNGSGSFGGGGATGSWKPERPSEPDKPMKRRGPTIRQTNRSTVQPRSNQYAAGRADSTTRTSSTITKPIVLPASKLDTPADMEPTPAPANSQPTARAKTAMPSAQPRIETHRVERNGYSFLIDETDRTREVTGQLQIAKKPIRSRRAQARAGGSDRRQSDDGGHYIAVRFNGPKEAFNHFAQDANFNRGAYRVMENGWAKAIARGNRVRVKVIPTYSKGSRRPSSIEVTWTVNGKANLRSFSNRPGGKADGQ